MGQTDPDRYYHIGLSRLIAEHGLLRSLPQAEDLGWGAYFPDKEFLFHVLTGAAYRVGGAEGVLSLVPLLAIAICLVLYWHLAKLLRPALAALLVLAIPLVTAAFMWRLMLLRPHLLSILCFVALVTAVLSSRKKTAAAGAAAFALSYHAFYVVLLVAAAAWLFRRREGFDSRMWLWTVGGLVVGLVANPYFPSNLGMGWLTLKLALGSDPLPFGEQGLELAAFAGRKLFLAYGFLPASIVATLVALWRLRVRRGEQLNRLIFLMCLAGGFWLLGTRSPRAMEYAVPAGILMVGHAAALVRWRGWIPLQLGLLLGIQGYIATLHYQRSWRPAHSVYADYELALRQIPKREPGAKVFNCEWETGSYILAARPDLRFVVLLEPALLWNASHEKYAAMQGLIEGAFADPRAILRGAFRADYVVCAALPLIGQMEADRANFRALPGTEEDRVRVFAVRPD